MSSKPHWLQVAGTTSTPKVVVSFDTETQPTIRNGQEVLTLRCWDAIIRYRHPGVDDPDVCTTWAGETAGELAQTLEAAAAITGEAWCFAHNAGFDLTVTSLPMVLSGRGWEPVFVNLGDETCVFSLKRDTHKITITDTWSWLRCSLQQAAKDIGRRKVRLPDGDDSLAAWHHRCRHDVEILDQLLSVLLDWWDTQDLGSFAVTGASCGWRSLRAKIQPKSILVGAEHPRTMLEREAIFGGRKEVWRVGRIRGHWIEDWDLVAAHLTTVAHLPMPVVPLRSENITPPPSPVTPPPGLGAICRVRIETQVPCAPCRVAGDVWWPVGTFETVLSTPELAQVVKLANRVTILEAQWYRLSDAMQAWGQWCIGLQGEPDHVVPKVVKRVAKGWGRAVPGRFALRTSQLISQRPATHLGWALETGHDLDTGHEIETLTYGGVERVYRKDQDGVDVSPVVLAFVEGYVRAAMAQVINARDPRSLLQCNTDGWWEIRAGRSASDAPAAVPAPYRAARKATSRDVTVHGPNHITSKGDRRLAGVPKDAKPTLDGGFAWQDWPGLRWQMQFSRPGEYMRPGREVLLADHYCRRWVLTTGETVPVSTAIANDGRSIILPWSWTACRRPTDVLADWQVPALHHLRDVTPDAYRAQEPSLLPLPGRR